MISNLDIFDCIKEFLIFCGNVTFHEQWTKKFKKILCLTSNPETLCKKLIELNKPYIIPNFNYKNKDNKLSNLKEINRKMLFDSFSPKLTSLIKVNDDKIEKNKYNIFCIKSLVYLNSNGIENDFHKIEGDNSHFNFGNNFFGDGNDKKTEFHYFVRILKNLTLLSLYFNQYPYLYNLLSFSEVKDIFNKLDEPEIINERLGIISDELFNKIMKNECILDKKESLKELQIFLIEIILSMMEDFNIGQIYQIFNFLRDIDFCIKIYLSIFYTAFNIKKHNFVNDLVLSLNDCEFRFYIYSLYVNPFNYLKFFNENDNKTINETLTIKNFIISGNEKFYEKIRTIEKHIKLGTFHYLSIEQISKHFEKKKDENTKKLIPYFYFLIIRFEDFNENYENFIALSLKSGISFLNILYMENGDIEKFHKNQMKFLLPHILVYSHEDILSYINEKKNFFDFVSLPKEQEILDIKIPEITFKQNITEDGCFELAETFPIDLIKNKLLFCLDKNIDFISEFAKSIYYIYKEHNALDLLYKQNCIYFGWSLYPELFSGNYCLAICFVKRFLYMYCREEATATKSFYRIINDDLRSRDPRKIYRYINILALINMIIEKKLIASFEGKVYRATVLDENLIMKLIPGVKMVNTVFWSTSKDFGIAEKFMVNHNFRNTYIFCKSVKNNIDIEIEELSLFKEKEVLFLPFNEFIVEKVSQIIKYGKKVFIIELSQLENKNFVNPKNMKIKEIHKISADNFMGNFYKVTGENIDEPFEK